MSFSIKPCLLAITAVAGILSACVNENKSLGESLIPNSQKYTIYTASFPIEEMSQQMADSLSAYSMYRFTVGAVRDEAFGLSTRSAAFTLVPVNDTLNFGTNTKFRQFHFSAVKDTLSYADEAQRYILQNINVYELDKAIDYKKLYPEISYTKKRITDGIPVYNGNDSLSFNFSKEFGEKFLTIKQEDLDTMPNYTKRFPGIVLTVDEPAGNGGRINMFRLPIDVQNGYIYGSCAELKITADYGDRKQVDTSFTFYFGPVQMYDLGGVTTTSVTSQTQIAFDMTTHESKGQAGKVDKVAYLEGGRGLKPVISAEGLRNLAIDEIAKHTDNPTSAVICKATLVLPFEFPENYKDIYKYPTMISPTCLIVTDTTMTFAGITDSSASDEDQGDINRSTCRYTPDISHHIQKLIRITDEKKIHDYDVWLLAMATEIVSNAKASTSSDTDDYYRNLLYANYYNSMYGGYGYGGYGYGGYGYNSYYNNNYYNYMMLQSMYSQSSSGSTTKSATMMDFHRYYKAIFHGPGAEKDVPMFKITYAIPKTVE